MFSGVLCESGMDVDPSKGTSRGLNPVVTLGLLLCYSEQVSYTLLAYGHDFHVFILLV